ncbi:hypothetical protein GCM10027610_136640 [Dactylosporangium cerinum]
MDLRGRLDRLHEQLAGHPEVTDEGVLVVEREPQVLAAALDGTDEPAGEDVGEVDGAGQVAADRPRVQHLDGRDAPAGDPFVESAADGLDLGKLRHRSPKGVRSRNARR